MGRGADSKVRRAGFRSCLLGGLLLSLFSIAVFIALVSALIAGGTLPESSLEVCAILICLISSFAGSVLAVKRCIGRRLLHGASVGAALCFLALTAAACSENTAFLAGGAVWKLAAFLAGGVLGAAICARSRRRRRG